MKKIIFLLDIDDYAPDIKVITYPLIERYAKRIGADIHRITERKWPDYPVVYEKLQIHELAPKLGADWIIYIDSDALVHPDMPDFTELLPRDTVLQNGYDFVLNRIDIDDYFRRDGRFIGTCNWFTIASIAMLDLWKPADDLTLEEMEKRMHCIQIEKNAVNMEDGHLIDDFVLSRNVARFGLKYMTVPQMLAKFGREGYCYLYHEYLIDRAEKVRRLTMMRDRWMTMVPDPLPS